ncbi:MAG: class I SAM-dependent methyltransferase [Patescibacteria group bacterium]|nr:class I SAM-dependent methyltransferase [Patescibacteria group bacterium]
MRHFVEITEAMRDYALLDSGEGEKLERYGKYVLRRPDPQALWKRHLSDARWQAADGTFMRSDEGADWWMSASVPTKWEIELAGIKFWIRPTTFKHTGVFPEQVANWGWLESMISHRLKSDSSANVEVLNLFGYTGGATLACAKAGAKVVHIDGSKVAIGWARENAELSGLADKPTRWILDDARAFVKREIKRGRKYSGIIMDPPSFGHGPEGQLWKIEDDLLPLIDICMNIMEDRPLFFLINGYAAGYSALAYKNILAPLVEKHGGDIEMGELAIREELSDEEGRVLPCGIFARWSQNDPRKQFTL